MAKRSNGNDRRSKESKSDSPQALKIAFRNIMSDITERGGSNGAYKSEYLDEIGRAFRDGSLRTSDIELLLRKAGSLEWDRNEQDSIQETGVPGFFVTRINGLSFPPVLFCPDPLTSANRRVFTKNATLAQLEGQVQLVRDHHAKVGQKLEAYWEPRLEAVRKAVNDKPDALIIRALIRKEE